jgi:hypothetical protein
MSFNVLKKQTIKQKSSAILLQKNSSDNHVDTVF